LLIVANKLSKEDELENEEVDAVYYEEKE